MIRKKLCALGRVLRSV